ncbi:IgGFc-binding protein-like [Ylistrum balloti]|uniref:IgGFc-binding protein-like n=1 Tax=Ylistrum balloti TaxID=509963 RepID=UPI002905CC55|nr:IgGFc-binding protein-like [Ylistrum balloti]
MEALYVAITLLCVSLDPTQSKMCHDHAGKEFIIVPFTLTTSGEIFQIHIANPTMTSAISGTIETPIIRHDSNSKFSSGFSIPPSNRVSIVIQNFEVVPVNVITDTAIIITTNLNVILSVAYGKTGSLGGILVFPSETLGTEYVVVTYSPITAVDDKAILVIAAAYPDTSIQLFPGSEEVELEINGIHYLGTDTANLDLAQYESIVISSSEDLTGIRVVATKPVAVYSGNINLSINNDGETDAALDQIPPISELGQSYIVVTYPRVQKDFIKIVSTADNNEVYVNSLYHNVSLAGNFVITELESTESGSSAIVTSSYPVLVALFSDKSLNYDNIMSDVAMTIVPPIKNYGNSFILLTPTKSLPVSYTHHAVVISSLGYSDDLRLDGSSTSLSWTSLTNMFLGVQHEFSTSIVISEGIHTLTSVNDTHTFGGYLYGTTTGQSYSTSLAALMEDTWTIPSPLSTSKFVKIVEDKLPFPVELSKQTTRTLFRCHQLCSVSTTCGVVAVSHLSSTSVDCRFYASETQCGPFQTVAGFKLYARQK